MLHALLLACVTAAPAPDAGADPLLALNERFRAEYRRAKEDALAHAGPLILVEGDRVVLRQGERRSEAMILPGGYTALKQVAHVPLALYVVLRSRTQAPLDASTKALLTDFGTLLGRAEV